jgi:hypothetical protein
VFDRALPLAEQGGKRALAAEAPDYPLGGVRFSAMVDILTNFSLSCKSRQKGAGRHIHLCRVVIAWVEGTANTYACSCW